MAVLHAFFAIFVYTLMCYTCTLLPIFLLDSDESVTPRWLPSYSITRGNNAQPLFPTLPAWLHNFILFAIFGATHSIMATLWFKPILVRTLSKITCGIVNDHWERNIYVLVASLQLLTIQQFWRPMPRVIYIRRVINHRLINL